MDKTKLKDFADKIYGDMAGAMAVGMADVGTRTGLFHAMKGQGDLTAPQLAEKTGLQLRYIEEWLAGMAAAGYVDYAPETETFCLPDEHAYLLASEGTDHFVGGLFRFAPVLLAATGPVAQAFRTGGGVAFSDNAPDLIEALEMINAGTYRQRLTEYWLAQLPEAVDRLNAGGRVLDVGCGAGQVPMLLAEAFHAAEVVGLDPDAASIDRAKAQRSDAARPTFVQATTADYRPESGFDLITLCDVLHDLPDPLTTLREIRGLLNGGGTLFILEPKAADTLADNLNPMGAMFYGFSLFHCMTQSLASGGPGLGTCMGPTRIHATLKEAGFSQTETLEIRSATNLFFAARA